MYGAQSWTDAHLNVARLQALCGHEVALLSTVAKWVLGCTAFAPALLTYTYVAYRDGEALLAATFLISFMLLLTICVSLLRHARSSFEPIHVEPTKVEIADNEVMSFLLIYLLPLITRDIQDFDWEVWVVVAVIFVFTIVCSYSYHFNPLLVMLRWHFYKITTKAGIGYIVITKRHLVDSKRELILAQLTEYVLIDKEQ